MSGAAAGGAAGGATIAWAVLGAYLLGSIPFGLVVARLRGVDLRAVGSGNIGATNAARAMGRGLGALVLACDALKAYVPVALADRWLAGRPDAAWTVAAVGLAAFLGHLYPIYVRLRGGKGVATALGVFAALSPACAAAGFSLWAAVYAVSRLSSLGSLAAATTVPALLVATGAPRAHAALGAALWALIVWKHRGNLARLWRREEHRA